jgi:DNA gyrase subunit A
MIINKSGIAIRLSVDALRVMGRNTQGVKLINLRGNDAIAAVCAVIRDENEGEATEGDENAAEGETAAPTEGGEE